jgi:hypothetical protein
VYPVGQFAVADFSQRFVEALYAKPLAHEGVDSHLPVPELYEVPEGQEAPTETSHRLVEVL